MNAFFGSMNDRRKPVDSLGYYAQRQNDLQSTAADEVLVPIALAIEIFELAEMTRREGESSKRLGPKVVEAGLLSARWGAR
ncbi:MAG: hypothetical protein HYR85_25930 [Planctomycetes bacterium]|nr:hypothetical protein [Planctomycetota bacterium]MBI3848039.1 hypothetical protein [Planctomycetota bacterium]